MGNIMLDCDLMRFPNSGLYQYCLNLGIHVNESLKEKGLPEMSLYVPSKAKDSFGRNYKVMVEKKHHRFFKPFLWNCKVWHAPFQSGRIIPKREKHIKVVLTIHDLNALHEGKPVKEQKESLARTQNLINRSNAIVCISEFCKSDVLMNCEVGNKPIYVIHNGTHKLGDPVLSPASYKPARPFLFGIGYVNQKKNFHTLLPLLEHNPDLELLVAGHLDDPDYITFIKKQARGRKLDHRLHILGPVSENDKAWYMKNCHAYMHPSLAEGFGATVVETMTFGKPLFLSSLTSLPEIGGNVAFYFKSFHPEHMNEVYHAGMQEYSRNGLSQKIMKRGQEFQWKEKAEQYIQLYQSLL